MPTDDEFGYIRIVVKMPGGEEKRLANEIIAWPPVPAQQFLVAYDKCVQKAERTLRLYGADGLMAALKAEDEPSE